MPDTTVSWGALLAVLTAAGSTMIVVVTAVVWLKGEFGKLGERLAKQETTQAGVIERVTKLEVARDADLRAVLHEQRRA